MSSKARMQRYWAVVDDHGAIYGMTVYEYWNYGSDDVAKGEFYKVLDEFQADILRIAEMRLEARARASGQHERMLRAQIAGFLGEESALAARERT